MTQLIHSHQKESRQPGSESGPQELDMDDQLLLEDLTEHFGNILDGDDSLEEEEPDLSISAIDSTCIDFLSVSYHIVFSPSYQVPVLYFNAYYPDGSAISHEEVYDSLVPEEWRSSIRNAGLNGGISQQDHPILNVPFFYMHPCETVSLMETVLSGQPLDESKSFLETYIMTWLSFTGQAIGISVPTDVVYTRPATDADARVAKDMTHQ
ncbi:E2-like conjugating enzyme atg10 [Mortierella polycephala]|uniref:Ubiquitin-like-conjugating enzyme ATG10 n=1 Tax=Mortierella polycephala TaxID=41804 RepID=A0A9P6Q0X4_9FUNG|nr:E2-like conjugating enzyme atg10 [Mortierella polycephala]